MNKLTFAPDFSSDLALDSQLTGASLSGLFWNRGVHPIVTVNNLISILPFVDFLTIGEYDNGKTYSDYLSSKDKTDIVSYDSIVYQSLVDSNVGNQPDVSPTEWLPTNKESLALKSFIWSVEENVKSELGLQKSLIENQFIYNIGKDTLSLPNDYSGWVFEPRGSDYLDIVINQICLQAFTTDDTSLYVVNQGVLIDTLTLHPVNGVLQFENLGYTISGKGKFYFVFLSQNVKSSSPSVDLLRYDSFVAYPVTGSGLTPEDASYSIFSSGNGLNFNVSVVKNPSNYVDNNLIYFSRLLQVQFEIDAIRMILANANNRSNSEERNLDTGGYNQSVLYNEITNVDSWTIARKHQKALQEAKAAIDMAYDKFINPLSDLEVHQGTI